MFPAPLEPSGARVGETDGDPQNLVFTTMRTEGWRVAHLDAHLGRMREHAGRLGIAWPEDARAQAGAALVADMPTDRSTLIQLSLTAAGVWAAGSRQVTGDDGVGLAGITHEAPRWSDGSTGTKHGDWEPYLVAGRAAVNAGADVALLIHDEAVVDADRATLLLLDYDGTAWYPEPGLGGVRSLTLESIAPGLTAEGIPVHSGRITATMLVRAREVLLLGTGIGVAALTALDGESVGAEGDDDFRNLCADLHERALEDGWVDLEGES
jgi:branched-subunit amino acid aminotransferase/4-amino-4-deoxychorismate lyase